MWSDRSRTPLSRLTNSEILTVFCSGGAWPLSDKPKLDWSAIALTWARPLRPPIYDPAALSSIRAVPH